MASPLGSSRELIQGQVQRQYIDPGFPQESPLAPFRMVFHQSGHRPGRQMAGTGNPVNLVGCRRHAQVRV